MKRVILISPFGSRAGMVTPRAKAYSRALHVAYAEMCLRHSIEKGEAPIAGHLLYPRVLNDEDRNERTLGMLLGQAWGKVAECAVVYTDHGISKGMAEDVEVLKKAGVSVEYRCLGLAPSPGVLTSRN